MIVLIVYYFFKKNNIKFGILRLINKEKNLYISILKYIILFLNNFFNLIL